VDPWLIGSTLPQPIHHLLADCFSLFLGVDVRPPNVRYVLVTNAPDDVYRGDLKPDIEVISAVRACYTRPASSGIERPAVIGPGGHLKEGVRRPQTIGTEPCADWALALACVRAGALRIQCPRKGVEAATDPKHDEARTIATSKIHYPTCLVAN
jgi:hypothetical protein